MRRKIGILLIGLVIASVFIAIAPTSTKADDPPLNPDLVITDVGVIHGPAWKHHYVTPWVQNLGYAPAGPFKTRLQFATHSIYGWNSLTTLKEWSSGSLILNIPPLPLVTYDHSWWTSNWNTITGRYIVTIDCNNQVVELPPNGENNNVYYTPWWPWTP